MDAMVSLVFHSKATPPLACNSVPFQPKGIRMPPKKGNRYAKLLNWGSVSNVAMPKVSLA